MKPRYEIHSLSLSSAIEPAEDRRDGQQDLAARALFSATEMATPARLDTEFGRSLPQDKYFEYQQRYQSAFLDQVLDLAERLSEEIRKERHAPDIPSLVDGLRPRDSWNTPLRVEAAGSGQGGAQLYLVRSAGPDGAFENRDDVKCIARRSAVEGPAVSLPVSRRFREIEKSQFGQVWLKLAQDGSPGLAQQKRNQSRQGRLKSCAPVFSRPSGTHVDFPQPV